MLDMVRMFRDIRGIQLNVCDQRISEEHLANMPSARMGSSSGVVISC
jgi:hypothetical protein